MLLFNHSVVSDSFVNQTDNHQRPEVNLFIYQGSDVIYKDGLFSNFKTCLKSDICDIIDI